MVIRCWCCPGLLRPTPRRVRCAAFLKSRGYAVSGWRQGRNLGLRHGVQDAMVDLVQELNDTHGRKVSLVGWSLGGLYARQLAKMMPDRVRGGDHARQPVRVRTEGDQRLACLRNGERPQRRGRRSSFRRRAVGYAAGADHGDLQPHRRHLRLAGLHGEDQRRPPKASRSRAAIAAWVIIRPPSTPWPIVWRRRKANGRRSIEAAGERWFIRTRIGRRASYLAPACGER